MAKVINLKTDAGKLGFTISSVEDPDTGNVKYFARLRPFTTLTENEINKWAATFMNVSEASMRAAFSALAEAIEYFVLNGHSVTFGGIGNFTFTTKTGIWDAQTQKWTSAGKNNMDDVSPSDIRATYVRFRPSTSLRNALGCSSLVNIEDTTFGYQLVNQNVKPQAGGNGGGGGNG